MSRSAVFCTQCGAMSMEQCDCRPAFRDPPIGRVVFAPRGKPMPQTPEQFRHMGDLYDKTMREMQDEINRLKQRVNDLEQKLKGGSHEH